MGKEVESIATDLLSKEVLVEVVDLMRSKGFMPDHAILALYKRSLSLQLEAISASLKKLDEILKDKKLSVRAHNNYVKKHTALCGLGNRKLDMLKSCEERS